MRFWDIIGLAGLYHLLFGRKKQQASAAPHHAAHPATDPYALADDYMSDLEARIDDLEDRLDDIEDDEDLEYYEDGDEELTVSIDDDDLVEDFDDDFVEDADDDYVDIYENAAFADPDSDYFDPMLYDEYGGIDPTCDDDFDF